MDRSDSIRSEYLYQQFAPKLYSVCWRYVGFNPVYKGLIEDCVQETFLTLFDRFDVLRNHPSIEGWLVVTCRHRLTNAIKDERNRWDHTDQSVDPMADNILTSDLSVIDRWVDDETAITKKERILSLLNEREQVVFLQYTDGYHKVGEIADETGMSKSAVKSVMARIRKKIKKSGILFFKDLFQ